MDEIQTTTLNNDLVVLAKTDRYGRFGAWMAINDTQAKKKLEQIKPIAPDAWIWHGRRCRYIVLNQDGQQSPGA